MALTTVSFCCHCKWRSSPNPINLAVAGAACPSCGTCTSALHYDPTYTSVDPFGKPYVEATAAAAVLSANGVPTAAPLIQIPLPVVASAPVVSAPT